MDLNGFVLDRMDSDSNRIRPEPYTWCEDSQYLQVKSLTKVPYLRAKFVFPVASTPSGSCGVWE
jgi:hypothetical protein